MYKPILDNAQAVKEQGQSEELLESSSVFQDDGENLLYSANAFPNDREIGA